MAKKPEKKKVNPKKNLDEQESDVATGSSEKQSPPPSSKVIPGPGDGHAGKHMI